VKRRDRVRYLEKQGCELLRGGRNHTVYVNRGAAKATTVPRHREISDFIARKICRDLDVPEP
jgi:mRNA interferase HicA